MSPWVGLRQYPAGSIQADNGAGLTQGIIGLVNKGQPRKVDDQRAQGVDVGHQPTYPRPRPSREARRPRGAFPLARGRSSRWPTSRGSPWPSSARPARAARRSCHLRRAARERRRAERVPPMAGNSPPHAGPLTVNDLPVDAHTLARQRAPPVFISSGDTLGGAGRRRLGRRGMRYRRRDAGPVYRLLGKKDRGPRSSKVETAPIDGDRVPPARPDIRGPETGRRSRPRRRHFTTGAKAPEGPTSAKARPTTFGRRRARARSPRRATADSPCRLPKRQTASRVRRGATVDEAPCAAGSTASATASTPTATPAVHAAPEGQPLSKINVAKVRGGSRRGDDAACWPAACDRREDRPRIP